MQQAELELCEKVRPGLGWVGCAEAGCAAMQVGAVLPAAHHAAALRVTVPLPFPCTTLCVSAPSLPGAGRLHGVQAARLPPLLLCVGRRPAGHPVQRLHAAPHHAAHVQVLPGGWFDRCCRWHEGRAMPCLPPLRMPHAMPCHVTTLKPPALLCHAMPCHGTTVIPPAMPCHGPACCRMQPPVPRTPTQQAIDKLRLDSEAPVEGRRPKALGMESCVGTEYVAFKTPLPLEGKVRLLTAPARSEVILPADQLQCGWVLCGAGALCSRPLSPCLLSPGGVLHGQGCGQDALRAAGHLGRFGGLGGVQRCSQHAWGGAAVTVDSCLLYLLHAWHPRPCNALPPPHPCRRCATTPPRHRTSGCSTGLPRSSWWVGGDGHAVLMGGREVEQSMGPAPAGKHNLLCIIVIV